MRPLMPRAFAIAGRLGHPVHDCVYLALAERERATLVTADERLLRRLGRRARVKVDGSPQPLSYPRSTATTVSPPSAWRARSTFLSNLPTLVFGTSLMNAKRSGSHQRATRVARNACSSAGGVVLPGRSTTQASGRSSQRASGIADDGGLDDVGMRHDLVLELDRRDPLAARLDDVLGAVGDLDEALRVDGADVAGAEPAVVKFVRRSIPVVGTGDPRAAHLDLAGGLAVPGERLARRRRRCGGRRRRRSARSSRASPSRRRRVAHFGGSAIEANGLVSVMPQAWMMRTP